MRGKPEPVNYPAIQHRNGDFDIVGFVSETDQRRFLPDCRGRSGTDLEPQISSEGVGEVPMGLPIRPAVFIGPKPVFPAG